MLEYGTSPVLFILLFMFFVNRSYEKSVIYWK